MNEQQDTTEAADGQSVLTDGLGLLPCPFCGRTPELNKHFREEMWTMIHRCKVIGPITFDWSSEQRIAAQWNTRA